MKFFRNALATAATLFWFGQAQASVVAHLEEVGSDVVMTLYGSLDLTGLPSIFHPSGSLIIGNFAEPNSGFLGISDGLSYDTWQYSVTGPSSFGSSFLAIPGPNTIPFSFSVGPAAFFVNQPGGVIPFSGQTTFSSASFSSFGVGGGINIGDHVYTFANSETFTIQVGGLAPVPLPASALLLLGALGGLGLMHRRNKS